MINDALCGHKFRFIKAHVICPSYTHNHASHCLIFLHVILDPHTNFVYVSSKMSIKRPNLRYSPYTIQAYVYIVYEDGEINIQIEPREYSNEAVESL